MNSIDMIINRYEQLNNELRTALATMERSDKIKDIYEAIKENQSCCPHFSAEYNWAIIDNTCPYCGAEIRGE